MGEGEPILVVDDDDAVRQVAAKVLTRGGYQVVEADGGAKALDAAEELNGRISLLLTDVVMPGMNGRELSDVFKERYPHIRIVFMSAYTADEVILRGVALAEVDFIGKPFTLQGLREKVREVLDRQEVD